MQTPDQAEEIARRLDVLVDACRGAGDDVECPSWRRRLIDVASCEMARVRGVTSRGWAPAENPTQTLRASFETWPDQIWQDPHALGWIHEQYAAVARRKSFADHVHREEKHASSTVTTQLYTPRWIADLLAREAMERAGETAQAPITILDPAVGGGQMLLAALDVVAGRQPDASPRELVRPLWGADLDERAVEVARRTLALEIARRIGRRDEEAEAICEEQLVVADALSDALDDRRPWSVVLTNPPYMGWRSMPDELRQFLEPRFRPYHRDLFSAFIARCHELADGAVGILAQQSIWYLRRFEKARRDLLKRGYLSLFVHLGAGAFWNLDGEKASVVAFVQDSREEWDDNLAGETRILDLRDHSKPAEKRRVFRESSAHDETFRTFDITSIEAIPGRPICHDLSPSLRRLFSTLPRLSEVADIPGGQNKTGRNKEYVRRWDDVAPGELRRVDELGGRGRSDGRWVFYSKGGRFAPWWGNWHYVVDWSDSARAFYRDNRTSNLLAEEYWFRQGIVYTDFGGKRFNARWMPPGCLYDMTGPAVFPESSWWPDLTQRQRIGAALAILNSSPARRMLRALNPTLHFQVRDVRALPIPELNCGDAAEVAAEVWKLVDFVRDHHRHIDGDPLCDGSSKEAPPLAELEELETCIDARICAAYQVDRRPIDKASVVEHHGLSRK